MMALLALIHEPEPDHPLRADLAEEFSKDRKKFNKTAEEFTKKHAEKRPDRSGCILLGDLLSQSSFIFMLTTKLGVNHLHSSLEVLCCRYLPSLHFCYSHPYNTLIFKRPYFSNSIAISSGLGNVILFI
ncbi:unnamed protein product [Strongylus vulgaris]|uniref:UBC core domain-containing protein n=1 Tax=Strongylus vulgaris TaxID=40348 RepID=A0A3P7ISW7_STRVU|nr:unnamed protein product [Strongylus vulgaris]